MLNKIKALFPNTETLQAHPLLLRFGKNVQHLPIWHFSRRSVSRGVFAGIFIAFLPLPLRTAPLIVLCVKTRAHLPIAIGCTWVLNFVIMAPVFYLAYQFGLSLLHQPPVSDVLVFDTQFLLNELRLIWQPLFLGSGIFAVIAAIFCYYLSHSLWRIRIMRRWRRRHS